MSARKQFSRRTALGLGGMTLAGAGLTACGGNTGGLTDSGGGGETLSQWYHQYGEDGTKEAATEYAAAYEDATVKVNWVTGDYAARLSTALLSGGGVDVFENNTINVDQAEQGRYVELTDIVDPVKDQFNEAALGPVTIGEKIWGIPMILDPQHFYYRKSLFEKAGIEPPETFDDLVAAATELTTPDQKGLFLGNNFDASCWAMVWAAGGTPLNDARDAVAYNTPGYVEGLGAIQQMIADEVLLTGAPSDWADPAAFGAGLSAITWGGCWALPVLESSLDDIGVFSHPAVGADGRQVAFMGTWNQQVGGNSQKTDAAKAFAKWLWVDQTEHQTDWALNYGFHIPPLTAVADEAEALKDGNGLEIATMAKEMGVTGPPEWTGEISTPHADAISNVLKNGADPAEELAAAEKASNRAIGS
ncbi:extracellular solute-binding protein [Brachybacterium sacelli]|uniref:Multiple sugar transport system substrate-binding protein n=1 Tax=Brachybacterium sacelli TaxID=173364 RepID=A0ABS4WVZ2_9MICO|nr:extracellular solute-binding protein [Brachybacterium sacelli]MBP2380372.1 multiple sugar transport system substrate-binding protein [Brachybacterium sacelli]